MTTSPLFQLVGAIVSLLLLAGAAFVARGMIRRAKSAARRILAEARSESEAKSTELLVSAQERALAMQEDADGRERDLDARQADLETRIRQLEVDVADLERQRRSLEREQADLTRRREELEQAAASVREDREKVRVALERAAGIDAEQARAEIIAGVEEEARREAARVARRIAEEARADAERDALDLVVRATQRLNLRGAVESTVSYIELPTDEMKGRIIGREGRNIRALEMATGIDVIVDDTPRAILISSFDPVRREIARVAIGRLIEDGRIHPARIEEVVGRVRLEHETLIEESGREAAFALGVSDLHPRLIRLLGRTKYRTHHGQNLLQHSNEVALIASHMAAEVGARIDVTRRAGLLHEIGRVDENATGHTIHAAADLAGRYGESEEVVQAIRSLHPQVEPKSVEDLLLHAANRLSDNRPGARKDNLEIFIERLRRLERIAESFPGVTNAYAVKAGREVRVIVDAKSIKDSRAYALSKEIARTIERDLDYTGQIKVSVVRQTRAVQFAL